LRECGLALRQAQGEAAKYLIFLILSLSNDQENLAVGHSRKGLQDEVHVEGSRGAGFLLTAKP